MNKKWKKMIGFMVIMMAIVPMMYVCAKEAVVEVASEEQLQSALANGGNIVLTNDIEITTPLYASKEIHLDGAGFTIRATDAFVNDGGNGSILAAMNGAEVILENIKFDQAKKYGVQAYDGGIVALVGVTITNSGYGAVLINGGGLVVFDLTMENNAYGIEFGKGAFVTNEPAMVMSGTIRGNQVDPFVLATNDNLGEVVVANMKDSEMKLAVDGKKLVLKNTDGTVVATSNEANSGVVVKEEEMEEVVPTPTPTPDTTPSAKPDTTINENPNTNDNITTYFGFAIAGVGALALSSKKVLQAK